MLVGLSSPNFCLDSISNVLPRVAEHFNRWEIVSDLNHYLPDHQDELKALLPSYDLELSVHAPFLDINIAAFTEVSRRLAVSRVESTMETAVELDAEVVTLHPGYRGPASKYDPDRAFRLNRESLERIDLKARDLGIRPALENMPFEGFILGATPQELLDMLEGLDMDICFDIGHANQTGTIEDFIPLSSRFANMHIHDNLGKKDDHLPLGEGTVGYPGVLRRILENYSGPVVIESHGVEDGLVSREYLRTERF